MEVERVQFNHLNLLISLRVGSRSPITFKTKVSVTTVNYCFQLLPIFCHEELHLRCCIGLGLNIITWSMKLLKNMRGHLQWSSATLGKYEKLTLLDTLKIHFQMFFALDLVFCIYIKWTKWSYQLIDANCGFFIKFSESCLVKAHNHLISSNPK